MMVETAEKIMLILEERDTWRGRAEKAEELLARIAKANVIFPSVCANNMEAWNITEALKAYSPDAASGESSKDKP